jgi:excisionase family DNA binding protein
MTALGKYLTVAEAAERLSVAASHVYRLIQQGRLRAIRFGGKALLVDAQSVRAFKPRPKGRPRLRKQTPEGRRARQ